MHISSYTSEIQNHPYFTTEIEINFTLQCTHIVNREHEIESFLIFLKYSLYTHYRKFYTQALTHTRNRLAEDTSTSYTLNVSIAYTTQNLEINLKPLKQ